jgi:hypothetical protein
MNLNNIYRICVIEELGQVILIGVDNTETAIQFPTLNDAWNYANNIKKFCKEKNINMEVYNGLDEAESNRRLHDVRNSRN